MGRVERIEVGQHRIRIAIAIQVAEGHADARGGRKRLDAGREHPVAVIDPQPAGLVVVTLQRIRVSVAVYVDQSDCGAP